MALEEIASKDVPHTPEMQNVNVAEVHDLQARVSNAERESSIAYIKLARETRKSRRLQQQIHEYMEALSRTVQDCNVTRHHFQLISTSHSALARELEKAKVMVETLEAVIQMLHTQERLDITDSQAGKTQPMVVSSN